MHAKKMSEATMATVNSRDLHYNRCLPEVNIYEENKQLKIQTQVLRQQLNAMKKQIFTVYEENLELKDIIVKSKQTSFVNECENQIKRLKGLVEELMEAKSMGPSQREEIKDRIIMKLQDELISIKIQLKQAKMRQCF